MLPPSFPFGGMENPTLTFATPTILAGDRSLVSLVAHELAHSWSGNLVTNATWSDFWLNEGFTVYFENRIMEAVYGTERAEMLRQLGRAELMDELATLPPADQILHVDLAGRDPDDGFTSMPYEKGAAFLYTIESVVGRPRLDAFLRCYFDRNAFGSMTTAGLLAEMDASLWNGDPAARAAVRPEQWLYEPGLPDNVPAVHSAALAMGRAERGRLCRRLRCRQDARRTAGPRRSGSTSCRPSRRRFPRPASPTSTGASASRARATARSCSRGSASPSATTTSPPCRPSSRS